MNIESSFDAGLLTGVRGISAKEYFYLKGFKQKVAVYFESSGFMVKTASCKEEALMAIQLRTQVFLDELGCTNEMNDIDIDKYDIYSDHLLLIDIASEEVVGTYRFNSNLFSNSFYSENEFNIYNILSLPGIKVELGRACIKKEYRGGLTLSLLWTGLIEYMKKIQAEYLFGCSSVVVPERKYMAQIHRYFMDFHLSPEDLRVVPRDHYRIRDLDLYLLEIEKSGKRDYLYSQKYIPGLVKGYISAGAKICGEPAYDENFKCYDCFTFLDFKKIDNKYVEQVTIKNRSV